MPLSPESAMNTRTTQENVKIAAALTSAFFASLSTYERRGEDISSQEVRARCRQEVVSEFVKMLSWVDENVKLSGEP